MPPDRCDEAASRAALSAMPAGPDARMVPTSGRTSSTSPSCALGDDRPTGRSRAHRVARRTGSPGHRAGARLRLRRPPGTARAAADDTRHALLLRIGLGAPAHRLPEPLRLAANGPAGAMPAAQLPPATLLVHAFPDVQVPDKHRGAAMRQSLPVNTALARPPGRRVRSRPSRPLTPGGRRRGDALRDARQAAVDRARRRRRGALGSTTSARARAHKMHPRVRATAGPAGLGGAQGRRSRAGAPAAVAPRGRLRGTVRRRREGPPPRAARPTWGRWAA